jgi:[amino group carrier protein]-lysine/ornithine hydrolase
MDYTTLIDLVKRYSPSGQEQEASAWLVERMRTLGYTSSLVDEAGNAVGIMGDGPRQIVLLGHIDTVPGQLPVKIENDILYGRGSVDAKGPLACFTDAVARVGARDGFRIVVIGAVEEERESDGARYAAGQYQPEALIIGEPNRWDRIALGYKGSSYLHLKTIQAQAHSAGSGGTASEALVDAWLTIKELAGEYNRGKSKLFDQVLVNLGDLSSGSDGVEQWAKASVGARLPLEIPPPQWLDLVRQKLPGVQIEPAGLQLPAWQCEKNTPLVRALLAGIRGQGGSPALVHKTGTADLNILAPIWKCPAAVYGPGDSNLDHTPDECISLEEYGKAVLVLKDALIKFAC